MRFQGKTVLVSGAGSGIGRAIAEAFGREGARVSLLGRSPGKLERVAAGLPPGGALVVTARHEDPAQCALAVRESVERFGRLDVLVNNAGAWVAGTAGEASSAEWTEALAANLTGPFELTRAALPFLRATRGCVVNVSSTLGLQPLAGATPYCVAKSGLNMLTRTAALEEAGRGVRVNAVCPGVVDTPIHQARAGGDPDRVREFLAQAAERHPLRRVGKPDDVAAAVLWLASDEAAWITGAVLTVDGGISLT